jgi:hypothetical protein
MANTFRRLGVALCVPAALVLSACGMDVQTLHPYTPAHGVNVEQSSVKVRNLLVIADEAGKGVVSASVVSSVDDQLTAVAGVPMKSDGSAAAAPLTVTPTGLPLTIPANTLAVLTAAPTRVSVASADLKPGLLAEVTLTFAKAGQVKLVAPVMHAGAPEYKDIPLA